MKKTRKKRAPEIDPAAIVALKASIPDRDLAKLKSRLERFEELRKEKVLNTPFIALEALTAFVGGVLEGKSEQEMRETWPSEWGNTAMTVPAVLIKALAEAWMRYKEADQGVTLGEAFGIEGANNQGAHRMKSQLATRDRELKNANAVQVDYLASNTGATEKSLEEVFEDLAEACNLKAETVRKHYQRNAKSLRKRLKEKGIIKG
jgi:hypothetical protein